METTVALFIFPIFSKTCLIRKAVSLLSGFVIYNFPAKKINFPAEIMNFPDEKMEIPGGILLKSRLVQIFNSDEV
jgi:hypothetical protein